MHTEMWEHPAVQENLATLRRRGVHVLEPEAGRLAGGDVGAGPPRRSRAHRRARARAARRAGRPADRPHASLVTAGGTREPIDPVRFVGNRSSGKMGHALAERRRAAAAPQVVLVTTADQPVAAGRRGRAGRDRARRCTTRCSAGADERRRGDHGRGGRRLPAQGGRDREDQEGRRRARDRARADRRHPRRARARASAPGQVVVGFAAETERLREHAAAKLAAKRVDLMVANDVSARRRRASRSTRTGRSCSTPTGAAEETAAADQGRSWPDWLLERVARALRVGSPTRPPSISAHAGAEIADRRRSESS